MSLRSNTAAAVCVLFCFASAAGAASFAEIGDATDGLPGQAVTGTGSLDSITGSIGFANDADLYRITITDPGSFSARAADFSTDPQLFLFDVAGAGIAANDDCPAFAPCGPGALLAVQPGNPLDGLAPGEYLLGITDYNLDPFDGASNPIFPDGPFDAIVGPNAGVGPLAAWSQVPLGTPDALDYTIELTGAGFVSDPVPEPTAALLYGAGLLAAGAVHRRSRRR